MNERAEALRLAIEHVGQHGTADAVVKTAEQFLAFLLKPLPVAGLVSGFPPGVRGSATAKASEGAQVATAGGHPFAAIMRNGRDG